MEKINYNKVMKEILENQTNRPRVLLHSCCAPCSSSCIEKLTPYADITIFYYNPNIEPKEEYEKRKQEEIRFLKEYPSVGKLDFLDCDYEHEVFVHLSNGLENEPERGARCKKCYYARMRKTAEKAKELGYDYFATTLTLSPLKDSQVLNLIGKKIEEELEIPYLPSDFKKEDGYKRSIELSYAYHLYRQNFCGCHYSKENKKEYI